MSTLTAIRDAGPIEIEDSAIAFEIEQETGAQNCIVGGGYYSIYPTYVTICDKRS